MPSYVCLLRFYPKRRLHPLATGNWLIILLSVTYYPYPEYLKTEENDTYIKNIIVQNTFVITK